MLELSPSTKVTLCQCKYNYYSVSVREWQKDTAKALMDICWAFIVIKHTKFSRIDPTIEKKCYENGVLKLATSSPTHNENWSIILK
jgi:hypothetical protein